uniref:PPD8 n=1 Tax=Erycina pusilla TaxID=154679 RepID=A0A0F6PKP9_9ASPA|nr:PPD8 [Erycina pusilla]
MTNVPFQSHFLSPHINLHEKPNLSMAISLSLSPPSIPPHNNHSRSAEFLCSPFLRRAAIFEIASFTLTLGLPFSAKGSSAPNATLDGISNTRSWFKFFGDGFSIRIPPFFEDVMEPEDFSAGQTFYGDKAKPKTFAARFASLDRSEVLSVVVRPSNQLKITFLEAKDITDIGSLKASAKIFVPGGANLYAARTYRIKEEEALRTYYFYEFEIDGQHVVLTAGLDSGKAYIAGASAPEAKWKDDAIKLRSAALSLTVL